MKKSLDLINECITKSMSKRTPNVIRQSPGIPRLVAVSKYQPIEKIVEAYELGQRHFGENYINELFDKSNSPEIQQKCKNIRWHFIGHLQKNKVNKLLKVPNLYVLETLDSKALAQILEQTYERHAKETQSSSAAITITNNDNGNENGEGEGGDKDQTIKRLKVMIQVNTSGEENKSGLDPKDILSLGEFIHNECKYLELAGLMTIGKAGGWDDSQPNRDFLTLFVCREDLCRRLGVEPHTMELSMGMSDMFEEAIELGSTNIRLGTIIFGERKAINK